MATATLDVSQRSRVPIQRINRHASEHGVAVGRVNLDQPIDSQRLFTNRALAPLFHSPVFAELSPAQQRRYNQLTALMQNELICFFEREFGGNVLPALLRRREPLGTDLLESLRQFLDDERQHTRMFQRLNQLAEPRWYTGHDYHILRLPPLFLGLLRFVARRPLLFPMVFWVMLLMEERSLMIGRRYAEIKIGEVDPQFAATYQAHAEDEVRHVQLDWHLLERFWRGRPAPLRWLNAWMLELFLVGLFLRPRRANVRLVELLIDDCPELKPSRRRLIRAVHSLSDNPGYLAMMYCREAIPIGSALFERLPELSRIRRRLFGGSGTT